MGFVMPMGMKMERCWGNLGEWGLLLVSLNGKWNCFLRRWTSVWRGGVSEMGVQTETDSDVCPFSRSELGAEVIQYIVSEWVILSRRE